MTPPLEPNALRRRLAALGNRSGGGGSGQGTRISIELPTHEDHDDEPDTPSATRTLVLAEDEEHVRRGLARALRREGFHVVEASDGADALDRVLDWSRVDALISDCRMPHMDGFELQRRARELNADLSVLLLSGDPDCEAEAASEAPSCSFARKPVMVDALIQWVRSSVQPGGLAR